MGSSSQFLNPPLATSSAPGAMSAAQNNQLATNTAKLITLSNGGWLDNAAIQMGILVPVTKVFSLPLHLPGILTATLLDAKVDGGGVKPSNTGTNCDLSQHVLQDPSAVPWAISFRGCIPVPASGKSLDFGLHNDAFSQYLMLENSYAGGAGQGHTKLLLYTQATASTPSVGPVIDGGIHTLTLYSTPAGGIRLALDWVDCGINIAHGNSPNTPCVIFITQTAGWTTYFTDIAYAV